MYDFEFVSAKTVQEASALLRTFDEAKLLAGGQTLIPVLKQRLSRPSHLVDLSEAARSLGMSHFQAMRHIVVPQAVTKVPAPMLNELISLLKDTTLVSVIAFGESVLVSREIQAEQLNSSALILTAAFFLVICLPGARLVDYLIKRNQGKLSRGSHIEVA